MKVLKGSIVHALGTDESIIIKEADKGCEVVLMD